jgi:hypothetical protein
MLTVVFVACCWLLAGAFDVGHHADLIYNSMVLRRYEQTNIDVAVAHAWLADYFAVYEPRRDSNVTAELAALLLTPSGAVATPADIETHFGNLARSSETLTREYAAANRSADLAALLGVTLLSVQRFYSLSNWAAVYARKDCSCFATASWFDVAPPAQLGKLSLGSPASLGAYCNGSNVESYAAAGWENAYAAALVASVRWIDMVEAWAANETAVYPELGRRAALRPDEPLYAVVQAELLYMYRVASWSDAPPPYALGRWKGPQSSSALKSELVAADLAKAESTLTFRRRFLDSDADWRDVAGAVLRKAKPAVPATPTASAPLADLYAVVVRTNAVKSLGGGRDRDKSDWYARVEFESGTGHSQAMREAVQRDASDLTPAWSSIYFADTSIVGATRIRVAYSLFDEDGFHFSDDAPVLINGANSTIVMTVNLDTGAVTGEGFTAGAMGVVTVKGTPAASAAAADVKLTVRVVRVRADCTGSSGSAPPTCHEPGKQVCEVRNATSRPFLSGASATSPSLSVLLAAATLLAVGSTAGKM